MGKLQYSKQETQNTSDQETRTDFSGFIVVFEMLLLYAGISVSAKAFGNAL